MGDEWVTLSHFLAFSLGQEQVKGIKGSLGTFISWKIHACNSGNLLGNHRTRERPPPRRRETERRGGGGEGPMKQGQRRGAVKRKAEQWSNSREGVKGILSLDI